MSKKVWPFVFECMFAFGFVGPIFVTARFPLGYMVCKRFIRTPWVPWPQWKWITVDNFPLFVKPFWIVT